MYRLVKYLSAFVLFTIIISFSTTTYAENVTIQANDLNIRSGPGTNYDVIGQVNEGEIYPLVEDQDPWVQISYQGVDGWLAKEYIGISETDHDTAEKNHSGSTTKQIITPYDNTNLRNQPSTDGEIVGIIPKGTILPVIQTVNNWIETKWEGKTGYIPSWTVTDIKPINLHSDSVFDQKVIVIDAGHGGRDVGAIGASNAYEKNYTMETATNIKEYLEQLGAIVYLTRGNDQFMPLAARATFANHLQADAFISIHYNSTPQYPNAKGISTYYYDEKDKLFSTTIHDELLSATASEDRRVQFGNFQVLRTNHTPALLLELGFISNVAEELNIQSIAYQRKISKGIIAGMQKYFSINNGLTTLE